MKKIDYLKHVERIIQVDKNVDYEILSFFVIDGNLEPISIHEIIGNSYMKFVKSGKELITINYINDKLKEKGNHYGRCTPTPFDNVNYLYELNCDIDMSLAFDCGMGVVRIASGEHEGKVCIYPFELIDGSDKQIAEDSLWHLKLYLQLYDKTLYDNGIKELLENAEGYVYLMFFRNGEKHMKFLHNKFQSEHTGEVLQFKRVKFRSRGKDE